MPRQARIDIPGLLQHVIVRGVARSAIFIDDEDRNDFIRRLSSLLDDTNARCFAWALLDNHVHLLLMPTEQPLAVFMRRLLTGYAVAFNHRHKRVGHLFQNRYKSIVCDKDTYLLELIRYIHLNPLRAGMVNSLDDLAGYRWCGHSQLLGNSAIRLINEGEVLPLFDLRKQVAVQHYLEFLADGLRQDTDVKLSGGGRQISQAFNNALNDEDRYDERVLGGGAFVEQVFAAAQVDTGAELPLDKVMSLVAEHCGVAMEDLAWPCRQPQYVRAKSIICYLATRRCRIPGVEVAERLGYSTSAVSQASKRGQQLFEKDETLGALKKMVDF